jgi:homoserine dehydrogenase
MSGKNLKIGMFGFGCVGQGLYDVLHQTKGIKAEIKKICVKDRTKQRKIDSGFFTYNKEEILNDKDIDIVVELIDDSKAAYEIVTTAMKNGKGVVTANKKMIAENFENLFRLQKEYKVPFLYEASSCASIPIIRNLEEYYDNDLLNSVEGIFNGSSNYILTKVFYDGKNYHEALKEAQELGFAESDPTLDVGGFDAKYKLAIITVHAFGVIVKPENIFNYGISSLSEYDLQFAREKGYKIKLMCVSRKIGNNLCAFVMPQFINTEHKLYHVDNEYNGVILEGIFSDKQHFVGKGAGSFPTGSAVLSDVSALTYNYSYEYKKYFQPERPVFSNEFIVDVYIRYNDENSLSRLKMETTDEKYIGKNYNFIIGKVNLQNLINSEISHRKDVFIALTLNSEIVPKSTFDIENKEKNKNLIKY